MPTSHHPNAAVRAASCPDSCVCERCRTRPHPQQADSSNTSTTAQTKGISLAWRLRLVLQRTCWQDVPAQAASVTAAVRGDAMSGVGPPRPAASLRHAFNQSQGMAAVPAATAAELQLRLSCQAGHAGVTGAPRMPCCSVVPVGRWRQSQLPVLQSWHPCLAAHSLLHSFPAAACAIRRLAALPRFCTCCRRLSGCWSQLPSKIRKAERGNVAVPVDGLTKLSGPMLAALRGGLPESRTLPRCRVRRPDRSMPAAAAVVEHVRVCPVQLDFLYIFVRSRVAEVASLSVHF